MWLVRVAYKVEAINAKSDIVNHDDSGSARMKQGVVMQFLPNKGVKFEPTDAYSHKIYQTHYDWQKRFKGGRAPISQL